MPMTMKDACERCATPLAADGEAYVCSDECTFCPACAGGLEGVCPSCAGELVRRPRRRPTDTAGTLIDPAALTARHRGHFPDFLGVRFVHAEKDRLVAELPLRPELMTIVGRVHGGALMGFADTMGAVATVLNIPAGCGTTTIESKTNFFAAARGDRVRGEVTPLHRGSRTQVWQTRITDTDARVIAQVVQTQMVLIPTSR